MTGPVEEVCRIIAQNDSDTILKANYRGEGQVARVDKSIVLEKVTTFYLDSRDFNGIPAASLAVKCGGVLTELRQVLQDLIEEDLVGVIYDDTDVNPHIIRVGFEPKGSQIKKLTSDRFNRCCVYPRPKHLNVVVDRSRYDGQPYRLCLALGEPQLAYRSFDLVVLEFYRNDPRYYCQSDDISGSICIKGEYYSTGGIGERDRIILESFGFSYDQAFNRAVAVYLRYLANLSPEHQQFWKTRELVGDYGLHPDYYRATVVGDWGERVSIFDAFAQEFWVINQMASAMARPPLFKQDFGKDGEDRPSRLGFLIRPTLEEFNSFVLLLDKMLSENINKEFFRNEVPYETEIKRNDGKVQVLDRGTLRILDDWIRMYFRTECWKPWDESMGTLRKIRKMRQKPAHAIDENAYDQRYFKEQRELMIKAYEAIRTLRMMLENHPAVKASGIEVPDYLRRGLVWDR